MGAAQPATVTIHTYSPTAFGVHRVSASVGTGVATRFLGNGTFTVTGVAGADGILEVKFAVPKGSSKWVVNAIEVNSAAG